MLEKVAGCDAPFLNGNCEFECAGSRKTLAHVHSRQGFDFDSGSYSSQNQCKCTHRLPIAGMPGFELMLAKCFNPACLSTFKNLEQGIVFRLESPLEDTLTKPSRSEYFWLCTACSTEMTLRLDETGRVQAAPFPESIEREARQFRSVVLDRRRIPTEFEL